MTELERLKNCVEDAKINGVDAYGGHEAFAVIANAYEAELKTAILDERKKTVEGIIAKAREVGVMSEDEVQAASAEMTWDDSHAAIQAWSRRINEAGQRE